MTLEYRSADLGTITGRVIELMVAPYGVAADLGGGMLESITRGAFGTPDPSMVALKLETGSNHAGPVIGRAISFDDRADGLFATFAVSETQAGDDALTLATDGAVGASAGMLIQEVHPSPDGVIEVRAADLREVTLTGTPAYQTATVLDVRSTPPKGNTMPDDTPVADQTATPDIDAIVTDAVTRAVDLMRQDAVDASAPDPDTAEGTPRGHQYRSIGDVLTDAIAHGRQTATAPAATERLGALIDGGLVSADGRSIMLLDTRVSDSFGPPVPNSIGSSVPNNVYLPEMLTQLREGRPVANLFGGRNLPADGNTIDLPAITVGNSVGYQETEGDEVDRTDQVQIMTSFPKATIAGGQPMSIQAQMWSNPSYLQTVSDDLIAAYAEFLDDQTINGDGAGTHYAGILGSGATDVPVTGDIAAAIALTGTAWAAVYAGSRRSPIAAMMHSTVWGWALNAVDTEGRPLVTTDAPSNPIGLGDASQIAGTYRGLPVILDDSIPATMIILGSFRDALLFEDQGTPAQISLTFPSTLVTDVTVYGFSSLAIRRPAAFAVLSGITA